MTYDNNPALVCLPEISGTHTTTDEMSLCDELLTNEDEQDDLIDEQPILKTKDSFDMSWAVKIRKAKADLANGKITKESLVLSVFPLIFNLAIKAVWNGKGVFSKTLFDELQLEGIEAACRTAALFAPEKGVKFSTFAYRAIQGAIYKYLGYSSANKKMLEARQLLQDRYGITPTIEEVYEYLHPAEGVDGTGIAVSKDNLRSVFYGGKDTFSDLDGDDYRFEENVADYDTTPQYSGDDLAWAINYITQNERDTEMVLERIVYREEVADIANYHDITPRRVNQIIKKFLEQLEDGFSHPRSAAMIEATEIIREWYSSSL